MSLGSEDPQQHQRNYFKIKISFKTYIRQELLQQGLQQEPLQTRSQPRDRRWAQFIPPKPGPVEEPELEELDKFDTKPSVDIESDIMAPVNLICTVDGCTFKTGDLDQTVAASVLNTHSTANHVGHGTPSGRRDRLQKLDRPVLTRGFSLAKSTLRFPLSCERRLPRPTWWPSSLYRRHLEWQHSWVYCLSSNCDLISRGFWNPIFSKSIVLTRAISVRE